MTSLLLNPGHEQAKTCVRGSGLRKLQLEDRYARFLAKNDRRHVLKDATRHIINPVIVQ